MTTLSRDLLDKISCLIEGNMLFGPLLVFFAGTLTSFMPCSLSTIPLVIGYVGNMARSNTKRAFELSAQFSIGMAITFTVLGTLASVLGRIMQGIGSWWYIVLGVVMVLMALQTRDLIEIMPSSRMLGTNRKRGHLGAIIAGMLAGLFSSPCATPVLVALLGIVAKGGTW